jgi:hypothetical protein
VYTHCIHPICNKFWQFHRCIFYLLWQSDELHQLLLELVKNLFHWLFKNLKARNVKNHFDHWFILVPWYSGLQCISEQFYSIICISWQWTGIQGMIRIQIVYYTPILDRSKDDGTTVVATAFNEMVMGTVHALCEFFVLVNRQSHSTLSHMVNDKTLKRWYNTKGIFWEQEVSNSTHAKVDEWLPRESHQLQGQRICTISPEMEHQVYGAEKVTSSKSRQYRI